MVSLPNSRRVLSLEKLRICGMNRISERFRAACAEYIVDFVVNLEEDGTSLPFLALENFILFLTSTSNLVDHLANLEDVIATVMMLVHAPSHLLRLSMLFQEILSFSWIRSLSTVPPYSQSCITWNCISNCPPSDRWWNFQSILLV